MYAYKHNIINTFKIYSINFWLFLFSDEIYIEHIFCETQ